MSQSIDQLTRSAGLYSEATGNSATEILQGMISMAQATFPEAQTPDQLAEKIDGLLISTWAPSQRTGLQRLSGAVEQLQELPDAIEFNLTDGVPVPAQSAEAKLADQIEAFAPQVAHELKTICQNLGASLRLYGITSDHQGAARAVFGFGQPGAKALELHVDPNGDPAATAKAIFDTVSAHYGWADRVTPPLEDPSAYQVQTQGQSITIQTPDNKSLSLDVGFPIQKTALVRAQDTVRTDDDHGVAPVLLVSGPGKDLSVTTKVVDLLQGVVIGAQVTEPHDVTGFVGVKLADGLVNPESRPRWIGHNVPSAEYDAARQAYEAASADFEQQVRDALQAAHQPGTPEYEPTDLHAYARAYGNLCCQEGYGAQFTEPLPPLQARVTSMYSGQVRDGKVGSDGLIAGAVHYHIAAKSEGVPELPEGFQLYRLGGFHFGVDTAVDIRGLSTFTIEEKPLRAE